MILHLPTEELPAPLLPWAYQLNKKIRRIKRLLPQKGKVKYPGVNKELNCLNLVLKK